MITKDSDTIYVIDGSSLLYRSYYGLRPLRASSGLSTQATYGFCRTLQKLIDKFDIKKMVLVWDSKGKTFRSEIYKEYKATRQAPPSDLFIQKEQIINISKAINLLQIQKTGFEADDLIASIVKIFNTKNIVIVGPDKDLFQLLSDNVTIYDPFKDEIIDEKVFEKEKEISPKKLNFFYSLVGDASDNIPGVHGIGKKTAIELVNNFESLQDLYENLDKVKKERTRELLLKNKDNAFLSKKLFSLQEIDLNIKEKDFDFNKKNWIHALPYFKEFEFKSLLKTLEKQYPELNKTSNQEKSLKQTQLSLFGNTEPNKQNTVEENSNWQHHIIGNKEDLEKFVEKTNSKTEIALDTETTGLRPLQDKLVGLSVAFNETESYYISLVDIGVEVGLKILEPIFKNNNIKKILHNTKFDQLALYNNGQELKNIIFDTLIAANLVRTDENEKINLKYLSKKYLNQEMATFKDILGKYKHFGEIPLNIAAKYAAHDALQTYKLKFIFEEKLEKDKKIKNIFENIEMPLSQVLFEMEYFGITLDANKLKEIGKEIKKDLETIKIKILAAIEIKERYKIKQINLNSPQQIEILLFDELKLPVIKKGQKGQRGTGQEVLQELSKIHPVPGMLMKYRELAKLSSTYIDPLIKNINPKTGRIHTSYSQTMVATGRLSSSEPNLQNIPTAQGYGIKIRSAFIAPTKKLFLSADYSQIELRVLAYMSKDKKLINAFLHDEDIHAYTASQIFNIPIETVTHEQRQLAKRINFGVVYGQTPYGLSQELGIKPSQAKEYIDKYFQEHQGVALWIEKTIDQAKRDGYVQTWLGRRRYVPDINEKNNTLFNMAKRIAINSPMQGTAAEIIKIAMINLNNIFKERKLDAHMILQIHDELVIEFLQEDQEQIEKIVEKTMINVVDWEIPLKVTIRAGNNWEEITK
ncbi:DNA polymerase I [Candidatus Babeliales bacterium]|nr:DNA polymerase I [Candidatus Babeliales bacterium]